MPLSVAVFGTSADPSIVITDTGLGATTLHPCGEEDVLRFGESEFNLSLLRIAASRAGASLWGDLNEDAVIKKLFVQEAQRLLNSGV